MTRVIHTGDTHLGYRQYHSPERRADFLTAFQQVVDDAIEEGVDAVVHAGDLFHDRQPDLQDLLGTLSVLSDLRESEIPFLAIVGNHEHKRNRQWIDLFERLGYAERLDDEGRVVDDTVFYGLDYVPESRRDTLEYEFTPSQASHTALVAHGLFTPFVHGTWDTETVLTESSVEFDAMLLGDNHIPDTKEIAGTWVTYCGSTERVSAAERDPRGYNIVEFDDEVTITRRGLNTREFVFVDLELGEREGIDRVRERVREEDTEGAVVLVSLEGDGEPVTPATVEEFVLERGALVARVNDRRETESESTDLTVSFADPDDAVNERVRQLGLSVAARNIEETVRSSKLADSNVRAAAKEQVDDLLEDDLSSFEPAPEPEVDDSANGDDAVDTAQTAKAADGEADAENSTESNQAESNQVESDQAESDQAKPTDDQVSMEDFL